MKYSTLILCAAVLVLLPAIASGQVSPDDRLLQRTEWDGAVVTGPYLEGQFRYQKWDNAKGWLIGPTFATSFPDLPQLETGARAWVISMNPDGGSSETGFSDIDLWGKYQFIDDPILLSGGIMFTLPTGGEKIIHPRASGEFNFEIFGALRYYVTDVFALIGHTGIRINADADVKIGGVKGTLDGETQFEIGGGTIFDVTPELDILGELNIATEAYKDTDNDIELTGGVNYSFSEYFAGRGGIGIGFDDGAPDFELILGASALF